MNSQKRKMTTATFPLPEQLEMKKTAIAFRGYNTTNHGMTATLLNTPECQPAFLKWFERGEKLLNSLLNLQVDLKQRILNDQPSSLETYPIDVVQIVCIELAQLELLETIAGIDYRQARCFMGYSLGEMTALIAADVLSMEQVLTPVLQLTADAASMAPAVTMGVLFSRKQSLNQKAIEQLCWQINAEQKGMIDISTILSPNTFLLLGQHKTLERFQQLMAPIVPERTQLKYNPDRWPPLHTCLVWQKHLTDRAGLSIQQIPEPIPTPSVPILSCVTGELAYQPEQTRRLLRAWVDHPQLLWQAIRQLFDLGIENVIHVGPEPNIIPATLKRLSTNVAMQMNQQTWKALGLRTLNQFSMNRPWLGQLLSKDAVLLRAPFVQQMMAEEVIEWKCTPLEKTIL